MPRFAYRGVSSAGLAIRGVEDAASAESLTEALRPRGILVYDANESRNGGRASGLFRPATAETARAFRYLATLLSAGFPLDRALGVAGRACPSSRLREALTGVEREVHQGSTLAGALESSRFRFPRIAVALTRAGEDGSDLETAVDRVATTLERSAALRARLASALAYPAIMSLAGGVTLAILLLYVLPQFAGLFDEAGMQLPASTRALVAAGTLASTAWPYALATGVLGALVLAHALRAQGFRIRIHALWLRTPGLGRLRRLLISTRVGHTLWPLLSSGVPLLEALDIAGRSSGDPVAERDLFWARESVRTGGQLAEALGGSRAFSFVFVQMVAVGEQGGRLAELTERAAASVEADLERELDRAVRLVEPAMVLAFGVVVGFVALSLLQAVYGVHGAPL